MKYWATVLIAALILHTAGQAVAEDNLSTATSKFESSISKALKIMGRDLKEAAKETGKLGADKESEIRKLLLGLCRNRPYVVDAAFVDSTGVMKMIEPEQYKKHEGADLSKQEAVIQMLISKKPRMGKVFDSVEGLKSVDVEYPVFSGSKNFPVQSAFW